MANFNETQLFSETQLREQIKDDMELLKDYWGIGNPNFAKEEYCFNLWVLTKIFKLDEEIAVNCITDIKDFGIDCWVHYPESKELYLIQNKYYENQSNLDLKEMSYFLTTPLAVLDNNNYAKKSEELQTIFNTLVKDDPEYKLYLHLYITNNNKINKNIDDLKNDFNSGVNNYKCTTLCEIHNLNDIGNKLYDNNSNGKTHILKFNSKTLVRKTIFTFSPEDLGLSESLHRFDIVLINIVDLYNDIMIYAENNQYDLFDENIREYLGNNKINSKIYSTLLNPEERKNFVYYNNGITILCDDFQEHKTHNNYRPFSMNNPKIVNGCQTVSTIKKVLDNFGNKENSTDSNKRKENEFKDVFVLAKILKVKTSNNKFYTNVVKYTNSQNSVKENLFEMKRELYSRLQKDFESRGFYLSLKPSDEYKFKNDFSDINEKKHMFDKAQNYILYLDSTDNLNFKDISIKIEKLLQVIVAFKIDAFTAYVKKAQIFKTDSEIYSNTIAPLYNLGLNTNAMVILYTLFYFAEKQRKSIKDQQDIIPLYIIGFWGYYLKFLSIDLIKYFKEFDKKEFFTIYNYFKKLTLIYKKEYINVYSTSYNNMIKREIDNNILKKAFETLNYALEQEDLPKFIVDYLKK